MPVRSLDSSVFKWPDLRTVQRSVRDWAERQVRSRTDILRIGYFGSYARGDWGVGSDLDVILIVEQCEQPFWKRSLDWNLASMPVPVDLLVYTRQEWQTLAAQKGKFYQMVMREAV